MFLEVVTRTFVGRRPDLLLRCHLSLRRLESKDWEHRILVDSAPHGVAAANRKLAGFEASGDWVWVLDDDDVCCEPGLIEKLRGVVASESPDAIVVRNRWSKYGNVLPPDELWGKRPRLGTIGTSCVVTRGDIWNRYREGWGEAYAGDFDFIDGLFEAGLRIAWLDIVAAEIPRVNSGSPGRRDGQG